MRGSAPAAQFPNPYPGKAPGCSPSRYARIVELSVVA